MAGEQPQTYLATLVGGQTYVYKGVTFEYKVPKQVSEETFRALKREAVKSVSQGSGQDTTRVPLHMFQFAKVKQVQSFDDEGGLDDEWEDDLPEVELPAAPQNRRRVGTVQSHGGSAVITGDSGDHPVNNDGGIAKKGAALRPHAAKDSSQTPGVGPTPGAIANPPKRSRLAAKQGKNNVDPDDGTDAAGVPHQPGYPTESTDPETVNVGGTDDTTLQDHEQPTEVDGSTAADHRTVEK